MRFKELLNPIPAHGDALSPFYVEHDLPAVARLLGGEIRHMTVEHFACSRVTFGNVFHRDIAFLLRTVSGIVQVRLQDPASGHGAKFTLPTSPEFRCSKCLLVPAGMAYAVDSLVDHSAVMILGTGPIRDVDRLVPHVVPR